MMARKEVVRIVLDPSDPTKVIDFIPYSIYTDESNEIVSPMFDDYREAWRWGLEHPEYGQKIRQHLAEEEEKRKSEEGYDDFRYGD
jgi:hypothetical protein